MIIVSLISGWSSLSKKYGIAGDDFISYKKFQSIKLGLANYSGCVSIAIEADGLHLKLFFLFNLGHPELKIPWSEILGFKKSKLFFFESYNFVIKDGERTRNLILPTTIAKDIIEKDLVHSLD